MNYFSSFAKVAVLSGAVLIPFLSRRAAEVASFEFFSNKISTKEKGCSNDLRFRVVFFVQNMGEAQ